MQHLAGRFSEGKQRVVISGSGWGSETLASFAARADALIHEAAYLPTVAELEGSTGIEVENPERIEREASNVEDEELRAVIIEARRLLNR